MKLQFGNRISINVHKGRLVEIYIRAYQMIPDSGLIPPGIGNYIGEGFKLMHVFLTDGVAIEGKIKPSELVGLVSYFDDPELNHSIYKWLLGDKEVFLDNTEELIQLIRGSGEADLHEMILRKLQSEPAQVYLSNEWIDPNSFEPVKHRLFNMLSQLQQTKEISSWDSMLWLVEGNDADYCVDFGCVRWSASRSELIDFFENPAITHEVQVANERHEKYLRKWHHFWIQNELAVKE